MRTSRARRILPLLALLLMTASVPLFALDLPRPASVLLVCGLLGGMAHLMVAARSSHRTLATLSSNLGRARRQQLAEAESRRTAKEDSLASSLELLHADVLALAAELEAVRDVPALRAWQGLRDQRREGVVCLLMGPGDAESILGAEEPGVPFEVSDLGPGTAADEPLPATAPHAVGAVLIDVDLFARAPMDREAWSGFVGWLRTEVPVVGFSRVPGQLALRSAAVSRAASGLLLPTVTGAHTVRFERGIGTARGDEA